ncbi:MULTISPECIES: hypothetical protein [unclassified Streptomyces]|uniref:hypothetical protein n=1 Tax=unclassified Streptomyces TaxID=2593676 RepID=UPI003629704A
MSGSHARQEQPSGTGLAVALLGLVGLAPPALVLAPHASGAVRTAPPVVSALDLVNEALTAPAHPRRP